MEKNLGHATAYGYAKSKGYSGTEDEFAQLMADYASVGQSAAQSAEQAAASATSASGSAATASQAAQTATSKAEDAIIAEGVATAKAEDAQMYAISANQSAESASTSAQTATMAASTATTKASEASESATTASTAKTDAETARDSAAQSASEAAASAASIDPATLEHRAYGAYVVESATGAIAHFTDGADSIPMKDVVVHIEPVQEGSGDPSPENVRPITGWTGAKVTRTGKNLLDPSAYVFQTKTQNGLTYTVQSDGTIHVTGTATAIGGPGLINRFNLPNGTYTYFNEGSQGVYCAYSGQPVSGGSTFVLPNPFTVDGTFNVYINLYCKATGTYDLTVHPQIKLGSTATDYEPYSGQTYDITFPSEARTVYGGTLDVTSGVLTVDKIGVDLTTGMGGGTAGSGYVFYKQLSNVKTVLNSQIADILNEAYTPIRFNAVSMNSGTIALRDNQVLYVNTGSDSIYPVGKAILPLATPITYTLTQQEITSLLGENNVWADTGDSEVEYRANTELWVQRKITEAVAAVLNS